MSLADIADIQITTESARVARAGFGVPLILSPRPAWTERVREYEDLAGMVDDGFTSTTPEYIAASKMFSQEPSPSKIKIGRCANKPTQRWAVTPIAANAVTFEHYFGVGITENLISYLSDSNATLAEIIAGLKADLDALSLAITVSDQTTFMRIVANVAGDWFHFRSPDLTKIGVAMDHADPGLAADLDAIVNEDNEWYGLIHLYNSKACVDAIAAWAETHGKLFVAATQDSAVVTTASSGTDDVGESLAGNSYARTAPIYHPANGQFADAAWAGACLPLDPGSETWMYKTLVGVTAYNLTATQRANAVAKFVNYYEKVGINSFTAGGGLVSANEFIDVIRFRDWLEARIGEDWLQLLLSVAKVPYTREGAIMVEGLVRNRLTLGVKAGGLAADPEPVVTVPEIADVDDALKQVRNFGPVKFTADLAGAIHKLTVRGVLNF